MPAPFGRVPDLCIVPRPAQSEIIGDLSIDDAALYFILAAKFQARVVG